MTSAYPLQWPDGWPHTDWRNRKTSAPFRTTFVKARADLMRELRLLGAGNIVISSWLPLRQDGMPYADAARRKIEEPGCAVYFTMKGRQMVIARDLYWNVHDNLRSIVLAISGLRLMQRHGGSHMLERAFEGFKALPSPYGVKTWREILGLSGVSYVTADDINRAYRERIKEAHPDRGGSKEAAMEVLKARKDALEEVRPNP